MLLKDTLAAAAALMITVGTMGLGAIDAGAATMKPSHSMLVCKAGSVPHLVRVKVHDKWHKVWRCHRVHHKVHHVTPKPTVKKY
jgi:hypothetical protein